MSRGGGTVVWMTGLPGSGKSTLANRVGAELRAAGAPSVVLDGDEVRAALVPRPGYDDAGREAFYATLAALAALLARQGLVVLVPATAHRRAWRDAARAQAPRYLEVHVATPLEECRRRDPKGLYAAAASGAARHLPGLDTAYEPPLHPDVVASGGDDARARAAILARILQRTANLSEEKPCV